MASLDTDIVVVGGGPAGLAASIAAAEMGAGVIVLEKASTTGGAGNMGMGPFAVETKLQRKRLVGLTREEAFKKFMDYTHWRVDARLVKAYIDKSSSTIDWLEDMGVEFFDVARYFPGSEATWHIVKPATGEPGPRAASIMFRLMTERAEELGVKIIVETAAQKIIMDNGRAAGVEAVGKDGETVHVKAAAVIIATGGFGDNTDMIRQYLGYEWGKDLFSFRIPGLIGDGIKMAWEAGAGESPINIEVIYGIPGLQDSYLTDVPFRQPATLWVNLAGERFINEELTENTTWTGNALVIQQNRCGFSIFDSSILKHYQKNGLDLMSMVHPHVPLDKFEDELQKHIDEGNKNVFMADSLEELAAKAGIDAEGLAETVSEYNRGCASGEDMFYKRKKFLKPLKGPRYYAGKVYPGGYGTLGGVKINHKTEVLTKDFQVIPGLYAAGTDACSIYGDSYVFILPGNTMGFALNSGRMAGENAAKYKDTL